MAVVKKQLRNQSGNLSLEWTEIDGQRHGVMRSWHPNGVLAEEMTLVHGILDGEVKKWNDRGELLGIDVMHMGTGILHRWLPDGTMTGYSQYKGGTLHGICLKTVRQNMPGREFQTSYWVMGKRVTKKNYKIACESDPSLPPCK